MTTELEKQFFETFGIEIPMVKTVEYDNDPFAHCDDWWYGERTFEEAGLENYTVNGLNQAIKEFKEKNPEEVKHNGVLTHKYRIVEAFIKYPQITDRHYLELIVLHNIYLETRLYHLDVEDLKKEILQDLIDEQHLREIKKDDVSDDMIHQVQAIFKGD